MCDWQGEVQMVEIDVIPGVAGSCRFRTGEPSFQAKLHQKGQRINGSIGSRICRIDLETAASADSDPSHPVTASKTCPIEGTESETGIGRTCTAAVLSVHTCRNDQNHRKNNEFQFIAFQHYILKFCLNL